MLIHSCVIALVLSAAAQPISARSEPDPARPLQWLIQAQNDEGGWGPEANAQPDVATTSLSGIALLRLGHSPSFGQHRESARKALLYCVNQLHKDDRFTLFNFGTTVTPYEDKLLDASEDQVKKARKWIEDLDASGGTALQPALRRRTRMRRSISSVLRGSRS